MLKPSFTSEGKNGTSNSPINGSKYNPLRVTNLCQSNVLLIIIEKKFKQNSEQRSVCYASCKTKPMSVFSAFFFHRPGRRGNS